MQLTSSELTAEVLEGIAQWPFLPYREMFSSTSACAASFLSQFSNLKTDFLDDGSAWLEREISSSGNWFSILRFLSLESEVLKKRMARMELFFVPNNQHGSDADILVGSNLLNKIHDIAIKKGITHISCPAYAGDSTTVQVLENAGYRLKDSIVSYHLSLVPALLSKIGSAEPAIEEANSDDIDSLASIASTCFSDRSININRFNSDNALAPADIGRLYGKFVENAVTNRKDNFVLTYKHDGKPVAFMTFQPDKQQQHESAAKLGKAVLSAVDPNFQGRGIYRKLLLQGCLRLAEQGMTLIEGKTQLSNYRVIHIWQTLGAEMRFSYHTLHQNNL